MRRGRRTHRGAAKKLALAWHFSRAGEWIKQKWQCDHCKAHKLYQHRNCRRYFPRLIKIDRRPCWAARHSSTTTGRLGSSKSWTIPDTAISECPVSAITTDSLQLLEMTSNNRIAKEAGAAMFGPDAGRWPAWFFEAVATVSRAEGAELQARQEALG